MNFEKMYVYRCRKTSHFSITEHRGWCGYNFNKINKEIGDRKKTSKGQDKCEELV